MIIIDIITIFSLLGSILAIPILTILCIIKKIKDDDIDKELAYLKIAAGTFVMSMILVVVVAGIKAEESESMMVLVSVGLTLVICGAVIYMMHRKYQELDEAYDELDESYDELQEEYDAQEALLTPEMRNAQKLKQIMSELKKKTLALKEERSEAISDFETEKESLQRDLEMVQNTIKTLEKEVTEKKKFLISFDDEVLVQEFGLYQPRYEFATAVEFKEKLAQNRTKQKEMIKSGFAFLGDVEFTVGGSKAQGKKMVNDIKKLLLRAFNGECDDVINKVTYANVENSRKRIAKSHETICKLGNVMSISISQEYLDLKLDELTLGFEYAEKKHEEKEEQKEIKARMREEARLQKEIEDRMKKVQKEETHYNTALQKVNDQIEAASEEQKEELLKKKEELEANLQEISRNLEDIDYRQANARAGYVYIISNIGSFGENVYKIGMTRRLEPMDRVDELGDASVPFNFDVHAMIFSDDAPSLENALHKAFENKKVNMVNHRREFFHVNLDEIQEVVFKNYDKTVEFTKIAAAVQYRQSIEMRKEANP